MVIGFGGKASLFQHMNLDLELEIGSALMRRLEDEDGNPQLSFDKADKKNGKRSLNTCEEGSVITGHVRSKVKN